MDPRRGQILDGAVQQIEKQFGKGSIMRLGANTVLDVSGISTGSLSLDLALGGKGVPRGRIIEVFGPESSGKTTLMSHIAANVQQGGGVAAFIDVEHAFDPAYARKLGVNLDDLLISQPDYGEQALDIAEILVRSNSVDVVIVDSVAALVPKAELEGEMGESHVGRQARLMSQALRRLTAAIARSRTCMLFTNQIREKIGVMFGNPETQPGGRALKFYASVRIDLRRIAQVKDGEEVVGSRVRATVVKNKIAPPFRRTEFEILFNEGISRAGDVLDLGVAGGVIERSGTWLSYKDPVTGVDTKIGQGRDKARLFLKENPDLLSRIAARIREVQVPVAAGGPAAAAAAGEGGEAASAAD
ncbi:MAG: recombinase RecA [Planctomycetes bacterium]|nr:recombinase RecA [Planctomycetota bacterium]